MKLTPIQIKEALTPLRDCGFIKKEKSHADKISTIEISKEFKTLVDTYDYDLAKKAVTIFANGKDRSKDIFNKPNYFRQSITSIIEELNEIETNQDLLNEDEDKLRVYDDSRYWLGWRKAQNDALGTAVPSHEAIKRERLMANESKLQSLLKHELLNEKEVNRLRERWNQLDQPELELLADE